MADTLDITEGTGTTIATQDEGGVHYQEVKLVASGTGTTEALSKAEDAGHTSGDHGIMALTVRQDAAASLSGTDADYQPLITDANGRLHVLDQNSAAMLTALEKIDDWDDANYCNVNINIAGTDCDGGSGAQGAQTLRVILATDDPAVAHLNNMLTALQIMDDWDDANYCNVNLNVAGTDVAANAGVLNAQTIRVTIATDDECNNYLGTIDADTGAIKTAVEALDNAVDGNYLNCNLNIAGTDCVGNAGVLAAGVLRVTIATDDECNNFLGTIDADTGAIKTATELIDDAIYIDDADWSDGASKHMLVGGLYQSTPQTITDGDVGPLEIDANGSLRTVIASGTVTTVSTVTTLSQLGGQAISMGEGVVAAGCQRVTLATDDDGVAHLATIAGDTTNIETAIQIIDDWDATHDSAASADGPQIMAAYDATKPAVVEDGDAVRVLADEYGRLLSGVEKTRFQAVFDSADATGEGETVHASAASTIIVVQSYVISSDVEGWIKLQEEDSTALTGKFWLKAGGGVAITLPENAPLVLGTDSDLEVICEAAGNVSVSVTGYTIPG